MIKVSARARGHTDRAGDPLDGLVNLFDVGIVLAVAFLLAALSSLHLTSSIAKTGQVRPNDAITVPPSGIVSTVPANAPRTAGEGIRVGTVYRTRDGRLIYVVSPSSGAAAPTAPSSSPSK
jgi:hypothetical protein